MKTLIATLLAVAIAAATASAGIRGTGGGAASVPNTRQQSNHAPLGAFRVNRYDPDSLDNPYGAGSPYRTDGLMNPYSQYGSPYSNRSWRNPYATQAPRLYEGRRYRGRWSTNRYDSDSTSNPYGRYGSPYSLDSINNPYGAGNPYSSDPIDVRPGR